MTHTAFSSSALTILHLQLATRCLLEGSSADSFASRRSSDGGFSLAARAARKNGEMRGPRRWCGTGH